MKVAILPCNITGFRLSVSSLLLATISTEVLAALSFSRLSLYHLLIFGRRLLVFAMADSGVSPCCSTIQSSANRSQGHSLVKSFTNIMQKTGPNTDP